MIIRLITIALISFCSCAAHAAECSLGKEYFKIRNSFDGGKLEKQGARLALSSPAGESTMTLADIGLKLSGCSFKEGEIEIAPWVEYHNDPSVKKPVESYSLGATAETTFTDWAFTYGTQDFLYQPFVDFSLQYKDDKEADNESGKASLLLYGETFNTFSKFSPEALFGGYRNAEKGDVWRITPYVGIEKHQGTLAIISEEISATEKVNPAYFLFRYYVEVWPYRFENGHGIQVVSTITLRNLISGEGVENPDFSTAVINYVFDKEGNVSIGLGYTSGNNPDNSFLDEEKTILALKVMY